MYHGALAAPRSPAPVREGGAARSGTDPAAGQLRPAAGQLRPAAGQLRPAAPVRDLTRATTSSRAGMPPKLPSLRQASAAAAEANTMQAWKGSWPSRAAVKAPWNTA